MIFRQVNGIPNYGMYNKTKLQQALEEFLQTGYRFAEVDTSEYRTTEIAYTTLRAACKRHGYNMSINIVRRGGKVYFENLRMREEEA